MIGVFVYWNMLAEVDFTFTHGNNFGFACNILEKKLADFFLFLPYEKYNIQGICLFKILN